MPRIWNIAIQFNGKLLEVDIQSDSGQNPATRVRKHTERTIMLPVYFDELRLLRLSIKEGSFVSILARHLSLYITY